MTVCVRDWSVVSAFGLSHEDFWQHLLTGKAATRRMTLCQPSLRDCGVAAEVPLAPPTDGLETARATQLARQAARRLFEGRSWRNPEKVGLIIGTGVGNLDLIASAQQRTAEALPLSPTLAFEGFGHAIACELARDHNIAGPILTVTSGCNSGADAIGVGLDWIRAGRADEVVVGGVEAEINPLFLYAMNASRALVTRFNDRPELASRPFDIRRGGNVPGEGAAFLLLSKETSAAKGVIHGYACRATGKRAPYNPFQPEYDITTITRTWHAALEDANLSPKKIEAYSANGSSSVFYDKLEGEALLNWGAAVNLPLFSIKGHLGQTGAVTPVLQLISALQACEHRVLPVTANCQEIEPGLSDLQITRSPHRFGGGPILCTAIGFGGHYYSAFVVGRAS